MFVKCGSGATSAGRVEVTEKGVKASKWERPLADNFVPKMGRPAPTPYVAEEEGELLKKDFLADNKATATKVVVSKLGPKLEKKEKLGVMPDYLVKKRLKEKMVFEKEVKKERRVKKKEKEKERLDLGRKEELLEGLRKRREGVLMELEMVRNMTRRKRIDFEVKWLDKDIKKMEEADVLYIVR